MPMASKNIHDVIKAQSDLMKVVHILQQVVYAKGDMTEYAASRESKSLKSIV